MRLRRLILRNYQCFRGEHVLELQPMAYGVSAHKVDDHERSNWLGKSTLMESIAFALYGRHRHSHADGFISEGEKAGEVTLEFDDGSRIQRARHRGKPTQLIYTGVRPDGGTGDAIKDEAQSIILERVGLSERDFFATCYFEQRAMAKFINADPGARTEIVGEWLRLAPLQRCEWECREAVTRCSARVEELERTKAVQSEILTTALAGSADVEELNRDLQECRTDLADAELRLNAAVTALTRSEVLVEAEAAEREWEALKIEGKALAREIADVGTRPFESQVNDSQEEYIKARADLDRRKGEREQKRVVARGEFDGRCPIAQIECPARAQINAQRTSSQVMLDKADALVKSATAIEEVKAKAYNEEREAAQEYDRMVMRLESLRERDRHLREKILAAEGVESVPREELTSVHGTASQAVTSLRVEERSIVDRIKVATQATSLLQTAVEELGIQHAELVVQREALAIFGKNGAQRRVAEGALSRIETGANDMLRACGIALGVGVQWSREGKGLADSCDVCGSPYPTSAKVRKCSRCGADRGPKLINKLDVTLTNRSGAAEDLAGAAVQLSASAWLRRDRESAWSTALLDEPFGSLDSAHRRQFSAHLATMLSGPYGFSQAMIIAHHSSVLDALPGRIEIESDGQWSKVRVVT